MGTTFKQALKKALKNYTDEDGKVNFDELSEYLKDKSINPIVEKRVWREKQKQKRELFKLNQQREFDDYDEEEEFENDADADFWEEADALMQEYEDNPENFIDYDPETNSYFDPKTGEDVEYFDDDNQEEFDDYDNEEQYEEDDGLTPAEKIFAKIENNKMDKFLLEKGFAPHQLNDAKILLDHYSGIDGVTNEEAIQKSLQQVNIANPIIKKTYEGQPEEFNNESTYEDLENSNANIGNDVKQNFQGLDIKIKDPVAEAMGKIAGNENIYN